MRDYAANRSVQDLIRSGDLERIVHNEAFSTFPNAEQLAQKYAITRTAYHVFGQRREGGVDQAFISGRSLVLLNEGDELSVLPSAADTYIWAVVERVPDNSLLPRQLLSRHLLSRHSLGESNARPPRKKEVVFRREGGRWKEARENALKVTRKVFRGPSQGQPILLTVKRDAEKTVVSAATDQGIASWVAAKEESAATEEIKGYLSHSDLIVHEGEELPEELAAILKDHSKHYVRRSRRSPNRGIAEAAGAARLAEKPLSVADTKLFNSLPQATGGALSLIETWRMGLDTGQRDDWQKLSRDVVDAARSLALRVEVARKRSVMRELSQGNSNVVFVIAHNDGEALPLPGMVGGSISLDELSQVKRDVAPGRIIVLITCAAGAVNASRASLAEILLENRLARTVFASPSPVDARNVPKLLTQLFIRDVNWHNILTEAGFKQLVTLDPAGHNKVLGVSYEPTNRYRHGGAATYNNRG